MPVRGEFAEDDDYDRMLRRIDTAIYRLTVRKEEDGGEGTAGVREPRPVKPLIPAAALELVTPHAG